MMDSANIIAQLQQLAPEAQGFWNSTGEFFRHWGIEGAELGTGGTAIGLAVVWYAVRIIRKVVSILFSLCILLLLLQLTGVVDSATVWEHVQHYLSPAPAEVKP